MVTRVGGIASGIDTETIISELLEARKAPITTLEDKIEDEEEKYTAWDEISTKLQELDEATEKLFDYSLWSQISASSTDESVVTATADNTALKGTYYVEVSSLAKAHRVKSDSVEDVDAELGYSGTFTVNGASVTVESSYSLNDIIDAVNAASDDMDDPVTAYLLGSTLVIERSSTGMGTMSFSESGSDNSVLRNLGILEGTPGSAGTYSTIDAEHEVQAGSNLKATVNGIAVESSSNEEVTDVIKGVTMEFSETGTATLKLERDYASVQSYLEDFIDTYNDTIDYLRSMGAANVDTSSGELTSVGVLQGEYLIGDIQNKLASLVGSANKNPSMDQNYNSLYSIGIWFVSTSSSDDDEFGHLEIYDEDVLENALKYHLDEVEDLFRAYGDENNRGGIMRELEDYVYSLIDPAEGTVTYRMNFLQEDIDEQEDEVDELYDRLEDYETQLWEHYAWMEDTVSNLQSQLDYVTSALG